MAEKYSAFEILQIAEQIEHNSALFYRRAAELFTDPELRKTFFQLADWEKTHESAFAEMRSQLSEKFTQARFLNSSNYIAANPQKIAGLAASATSDDPTAKFTGTETRQQILQTALEKEHDTIEFFEDLKGFIRSGADKRTVDQIIEEENKHVVILSQSLQQL